MNELVFLVKNNDDLSENIAELLELAKYDVKQVSAAAARTIWKDNRPSILIVNQLTLKEPVSDFINDLRNRVDKIVVFCSNQEDPSISDADLKIILPFEEHELLKEISDLFKTELSSD